MKSSNTCSEKTVRWPMPPARGPNSMKMELIQPFINAADAVLSQGLQSATKVGNLTMEEDAYRCKGRGRHDCADRRHRRPDRARSRSTNRSARGQPLCRVELARVRFTDQRNYSLNWPIRSSATPSPRSTIRDFHFRVHPPMLVTTEEGGKSSEDVEALMICFETSLGNVFMNVALRYNRTRMADHAAVGA